MFYFSTISICTNYLLCEKFFITSQFLSKKVTNLLKFIFRSFNLWHSAFFITRHQFIIRGKRKIIKKRFLFSSINFLSASLLSCCDGSERSKIFQIFISSLHYFLLVFIARDKSSSNAWGKEKILCLWKCVYDTYENIFLFIIPGEKSQCLMRFKLCRVYLCGTFFASALNSYIINSRTEMSSHMEKNSFCNFEQNISHFPLHFFPLSRKLHLLN